MEPIFLGLDEVMAIHADQIRRYGGSAGLRDVARGQADKAVVADFLRANAG